jgi:phosphinothricin acetyltransferase
MLIRPAHVADAAAISEIYNHFVRETIVTFEEVPVSEVEMARRIASVTERFPWHVCEDENGLAGYAYAAPWMTRSAYRLSVETTVYVGPGRAGRGFGSRLYETLLEDLRERRLHLAVGGIALPNPASIALHEKLGFRHVGRFREVGFKFGRWIDVGYWELKLS